MCNVLTEWDERRLILAQTVASWSKDKDTAKVGAALADAQGRVIALGYNGSPWGIEDTSDRFSNNEEKNETILHAEMNAVLIANRSAQGGTLYVVGKPVCSRCASVIIQAGICRVVGEYPCKPTSKWTPSGLRALEMFREAKVKFTPHHVSVPCADDPSKDA